MRAWIGIEKEGRFKGIKTLFITTNVSFKEINSILKEHIDIKQLYFGAGKCSVPNWEVIKKTIKKYQNVDEYFLYKVITVELELKFISEVPKYFIDKINFMFTINDKNASKLINHNPLQTMIKLQHINKDTKYLKVFDLCQGYETDMSEHIDKTYKGDIVVLE